MSGAKSGNRDPGCTVHDRHPEVAAKRPSKDATRALQPSPFEARGACHRADHFGPDP